ncbi:UNVERIFIED_CONTAM: hypothetical protein Sradi_6155500 [Sesamum radiatum]|uniref:Transposase Tnp1/En/Spm-like domain-containing protein n=1 Tax=Sesamum radiatum TaxID=300843 RepID=A0AAW2K926_SESRA
MPFVLASQAEQVFYVQDPVDTRWHVVNKAILRGFYNMLGHEFADDVALWERLDNDSTIRPWCIVSLSIKVTPFPLNLNMKLSEIARANRSQLKMSHISGRKSYARIRADEIQLSSIEFDQSESSHCVASRFDSLSKVLGEDRHGYVRTFGLERMLGMQKTIEEMAMQMRSMRMAMENMPSGRSDATQHVDCTYAFPPNFPQMHGEQTTIEDMTTQMQMQSTSKSLPTSDSRQRTHPPELTKSSQPECSKLTRTSQSLEPSSTSSFLHDQDSTSITQEMCSQVQSHSFQPSSSTQLLQAARVDLLNFKTPEEVVAQGRVICKNPNQEVGGFKLGPDFWEVYIEVAVKEQEFLIRPPGHFSTIKEVVGSTIAWPSTKKDLPSIAPFSPKFKQRRHYSPFFAQQLPQLAQESIVEHRAQLVEFAQGLTIPVFIPISGQPQVRFLIKPIEPTGPVPIQKY